MWCEKWCGNFRGVILAAGVLYKAVGDLTALVTVMAALHKVELLHSNPNLHHEVGQLHIIFRPVPHRGVQLNGSTDNYFSFMYTLVKKNQQVHQHHHDQSDQAGCMEQLEAPALSQPGAVDGNQGRGHPFIPSRGGHGEQCEDEEK